MTQEIQDLPFVRSPFESRKLSPEELGDLWTRHEAGDLEARALLLETYWPLVKRVCAKMHRAIPQHVEQEEVASWGVLGLIRAVEHFKRSFGVQFETYAVASIRSAVLDEQRRVDWAPRSLRRKQRDINKAKEGLEADLKRVPTSVEIGEKLGISEEEVRSTLIATETSYAKSLDEAMSEEHQGGTRVERVRTSLRPYDAWMTSLIGKSLGALIETFTPQERLVLTLYYYYGVTLAEAGRIAGIPESRASQVHSRVVTRVRGELISLLRPSE